MNHMSNQNNKISWMRYWPLMVLVVIAGLVATALNWQEDGNMRIWMHYYMGIFLVFFGTLKIFNPQAFVASFEKYDVIGSHSRLYAYSYPWIELMIGLAYLSFLFPHFVYLITLFIAGIGVLSVMIALRKGLEMNCPCMGAVLNVPLSTVTLIEDMAMGVMAFWLLLNVYVS